MRRKHKDVASEKARALHNPIERGSALAVIRGVQGDALPSPVTDLPSAGKTAATEQMTVRVGGAGVTG